MAQQRHPSYAPFSPEERYTIRRSVAEDHSSVPCPRCHKTLESGPPVAGGGSIGEVWVVRCEDCQRQMVVQGWFTG